jgi:hypothetical protein
MLSMEAVRISLRRHSVLPHKILLSDTVGFIRNLSEVALLAESNVVVVKGMEVAVRDDGYSPKALYLRPFWRCGSSAEEQPPRRPI